MPAFKRLASAFYAAVGDDPVLRPLYPESLKEAEDAVDDDGVDDAFKDGTQHACFSFSFVMCIASARCAIELKFAANIVRCELCSLRT